MNITSLTEVKPNPNIPAFASGDTRKVSTKVVEGDKERTQVFQGVVIRVRHSGAGSSFTVRRVTYGVGVERTFPLHSPRVEKVEVVRRGKTRRAKLYYLRGLSAKASRIKERRLSPQELEQEREEARRLKQEQELERDREKARKLEQEPELEQEQEEPPKLEQEQEPELEQKQEEAPKLELKQEPELEQKQEEPPKLELEQEPESEQEQEEAPKLELEQEPELEQEQKQD